MSAPSNIGKSTEESWDSTDSAVLQQYLEQKGHKKTAQKFTHALQSTEEAEQARQDVITHLASTQLGRVIFRNGGTTSSQPCSGEELQRAAERYQEAKQSRDQATREYLKSEKWAVRQDRAKNIGASLRKGTTEAAKQIGKSVVTDTVASAVLPIPGSTIVGAPVVTAAKAGYAGVQGYRKEATERKEQNERHIQRLYEREFAARAPTTHSSNRPDPYSTTTADLTESQRAARRDQGERRRGGRRGGGGSSSPSLEYA